MKLLGILLVASQFYSICASEINDTDVDPETTPAAGWFWKAVGMGASAVKGAGNLGYMAVSMVSQRSNIDPDEEPDKPTYTVSAVDEDVDGEKDGPVDIENKTETAQEIKELVSDTSTFNPGVTAGDISSFDIGSISSNLTEPLAGSTVDNGGAATENSTTVSEESPNGFCKVVNETTEFKEKQSGMFWLICGLIALLILVPVPMTYYCMIIRRSGRKHPV